MRKAASAAPTVANAASSVVKLSEVGNHGRWKDGGYWAFPYPGRESSLFSLSDVDFEIT